MGSVEILIKPQTKKSFLYKDIWQFRELLYFLAWRDIKVRYKQTIIGILWAVLQPFLTMIVFTFFFNRVVGVSSGNIPYPAFVFSGLLFWNYFSTSLQNVSDSLLANQSIITKVFFPRIIIPASSTIVPVVDFFLALVFFIAILLFFQAHFSLSGILFIIPGLLFCMLTAIGLGSMLSILNVRYRDIRYALPFFIQLLLFITPVIYPIQNVPEKLQPFLYLNPLTGIIEAAKSLLFFQSFPTIGFTISAVSSIVIFLIGLAFFIKYERGIADSL